jgi:prevent-host-death family protein
MGYVSKSKLKPRVLEYLREVEKHRHEIVVTDRGRPVARIVPYTADVKARERDLARSVVRFDDPTEPVGAEDWEALR